MDGNDDVILHIENVSRRHYYRRRHVQTTSHAYNKQKLIAIIIIYFIYCHKNHSIH